MTPPPWLFWSVFAFGAVGVTIIFAWAFCRAASDVREEDDECQTDGCYRPVRYTYGPTALCADHALKYLDERTLR